MGYYNDMDLGRTAEDAELDRRDGLGLDEPIYAYTRAQALADGVLIDVSETAREAGFVVPVALTAALWADIEAIPERFAHIQDTAGRLWDVLLMGLFAARRAGDAQELRYELIMQVAHSRKSYYQVKMVVGPGDEGELVITLMRPDED